MVLCAPVNFRASGDMSRCVLVHLVYVHQGGAAYIREGGVTILKGIVILDDNIAVRSLWSTLCPS